jgi:hypothetical protein
MSLIPEWLLHGKIKKSNGRKKNIKKGKEKRKESKERKMTYFVYLELPDSAVL